MIRTGLIGLGNWGKRLLPILEMESEVVSCANRSDIESRDWLVENYPDVKHTYDVGDIFRDESIKAVVISTPIHTHFNLARQALVNGKHVFVEKPLVTSVQEVAELYDLARSKDLALTTGYIFLHNPVMREIQKIIDEDPVISLQMIWEKYGTFGESIYWNLISHELSIAFNLLGASLERMSLGEEMGTISDVDMTNLELQFSGGRVCNIATNRISQTKRKAIQIQTASSRSLEWEYETLYEVSYPGERTVLFNNEANSLRIELGSFVESIDSGSHIYQEEMNAFITRVLRSITH